MEQFSLKEQGSTQNVLHRLALCAGALTHTSTNTHTFTHKHAHHACKHAHVRAHTYTYTYTHTHTLKPIHSQLEDTKIWV